MFNFFSSITLHPGQSSSKDFFKIYAPNLEINELAGHYSMLKLGLHPLKIILFIFQGYLVRSKITKTPYFCSVDLLVDQTLNRF